MDYISKTHSKFIRKIVDASLIIPNVYTIIPTLVFLLSCFVLLYQHIHRNASYFTRWHVCLKKNLMLQWIFFNICRIWYILLSCTRKAVKQAYLFIEENVPDKDIHFNKTVTNITAVIIITTLALTPLILLYVNYMYKSEMPNFLMWVIQDPWIRHEIGVAGRCLTHPITEIITTKDRPYRTKRSNSVDFKQWINTAQKPNYCRSCKSMIERSKSNNKLHK